MTVVRRRSNRGTLSSSAAFCAKLFAYFDVSARSACRERALFDDDEDNSWLEPSWRTQRERQRIDGLLGCSSELMSIVGQITDLARYKSSSLQGTDDDELLDGRVRRLHARLESLEQWTPLEDARSASGSSSASSSSSTVLLTAESKRQAALVFIAAALDDVPVGSPSLASLVRTTLDTLLAIPADELSPGLLWPLFVTGCEADDDRARLDVLSRFEAMDTRLGFGNIRRARAVVLTVWKQRDLLSAAGKTATTARGRAGKGNMQQGRPQRNDWRSLVVPLSWKLSLA
jgi:hypothetical protein